MSIESLPNARSQSPTIAARLEHHNIAIAHRAIASPLAQLGRGKLRSKFSSLLQQSQFPRLSFQDVVHEAHLIYSGVLSPVTE
eukprot:CAMPEP_0113278398 /NCGR_PEP_ID=MMETSP0008_2-20120614/26584_1 /TAXON_ID=97485 /ORGANISM="Prymnesium parvum" /LENGTH=82 /DNA_ID=CAMNT_0000128421 /DNA_START=924 /DNA_END=1172 /DNA_ORIENTATION=+ /assembly_acc=CAM_ASM_000153